MEQLKQTVYAIEMHWLSKGSKTIILKVVFSTAVATFHSLVQQLTLELQQWPTRERLLSL